MVDSPFVGDGGRDPGASKHAENAPHMNKDFCLLPGCICLVNRLGQTEQRQVHTARLFSNE